MPKKHSEITSSDEIHVPKGFTEADNSTALVKNDSGILEYRDLSTLGATGPAGDPGTTLVSTPVVDIMDPSVELSVLGGNAGDTMQVRQEIAAAEDCVSTYIFDTSGIAAENIPFSVDGSGGQWILLAGTPFNRITEGAASTGIVDGGVLSINGDNTKFDVAAGEGWVIDNYTDPTNPFAKYVKWDALTAQAVTYMAVADFTFISVDSSGTLIQRFTPFTQSNKRQEIYLGVLVHSNNITITSTSYNPVPAYGVSLVSNDLANAIGPSINITGNIISAGGANLRISKSAGTSFGVGTNYNNDRTAPNTTTDAVQTLATFNQLYRDGVGGYTVVPFTTDIDPNFYDNGSGTLVAMPAGKFQAMRIYFSGSETSINVNQGQVVYDTLVDALAAVYAEDPDINPIMENILLRSILIVKEGTTNLQIEEDAKFIEIGALGDLTFDTVSKSTTTVQAAYDNSSDPEIIVADETVGAFTIKDSATNSNRDNILEVKDTSDVEVVGITRNGIKVSKDLIVGTDSFMVDPATDRSSFNGPVGSAVLTIHDNGTADNPILNINADDASPWALVINNETYSGSDTQGFKFQVTDTGDSYLYAADDTVTPGDFKFATDNTVRLTIDGTDGEVSVVNNIRVEGQAYSETNNLTDAATIATDCDLGNVHEVILTDNRTLGAPTNLKDGATYIWIIKQDVGGTNTLAYNAVFKFPGGTAPTLTTTGGAVDILTGVSDGTNIYCSLSADFK